MPGEFIARNGVISRGNVVVTGSLTTSGSLTTTGTITATTLVVQTITSSISSVTGSTNFGSLVSNTHTFTGSLNVTGALAVTTNGVEFQVNPTGVNLGNALTDSHIVSGSLRVNPNGLFVSGSGLVGIGTTVPSYTLDVSGSGRFNGNGVDIFTSSGVGSSGVTGLLRVVTAGTSTGIAIGQANSSRYTAIQPNEHIIYNDDFFMRTNGAFPLSLGTNNTIRLTITSAGNVGIGTSSPGGKLEIVGGVNTYQRITNTTHTISLDFVAGMTAAYVATPGNYPLVLGTNDAEKLRITAGGFTKASNNGSYAVPTGTFHELVSNVTNYQTATFTNSASSPYGIEVLFNGADPNNATNWGLGFYTSSPSFAWIYRIYSNGTVAARSDARWKKNIETTRNGYLEHLCKLRVVKYNWYNHEEDAPKELGLIAQEVEEVFPNLVSYDKVTTKKQVEQEDGTFIEQEVEDGETRSIKTSVLPYMLLKAIQEQNTLITDLRTEIEELKARI